MTLVMKIEGLATGQRTPFDGQYLKEYDPDRGGTDTQGQAVIAHVVTTPNRDEAMRFTDAAHLHRVWTQVPAADPVRPDGKPNRPLTAFTVSTEVIPDA